MSYDAKGYDARLRMLRLNRHDALETPCNHSYPCAHHAAKDAKFDGVFQHHVPEEPIDDKAQEWEFDFTLKGTIRVTASCGSEALRLAEKLGARDLIARAATELDIDFEDMPKRTEPSSPSDAVLHRDRCGSEMWGGKNHDSRYSCTLKNGHGGKVHRDSTRNGEQWPVDTEPKPPAE